VVVLLALVAALATHEYRKDHVLGAMFLIGGSLVALSFMSYAAMFVRLGLL